MRFVSDQRSRASRRRPAVLLSLASSAAVLAICVPALGLLGAHPRPPGNYWKWEGDAKHYRGGGHVDDRSASTDKKLDLLCKRPTYRASHGIFCPGSRLRPRAVATRPGRRTANEASTTGEWDFGPASPVRPSPYLAPNYAINQILLPTGKILLISKPTDDAAAGENRPDNASGTAHVFDPLTGQYKAVDPPNIPGQDSADTPIPNLFCVGHVQLADGRILVAGGQRASSTATHGIQGHRGVWIFNPWTETWQVQGLMRHGRWYPTLTLLADGRVAIMSGFDEFGRIADAAHPGIEGERINREIEVFTPNANPSQPGTLALVSPGLPADTFAEGPSHAMDLYPRNVLLPDGRILMAGESSTPSVLTPRTTGAGNWNWQDLPEKNVFAGSGYEYGLWSTSVLRPIAVDSSGNAASTQVQLIGGAAGPSVHGKTHTFVLNTANVGAGFPQVPPANSIQVPRAHHNTVQLPDSSMVVIGGGLGNTDPGDVPEVVGGNHLYDGPVFSTEVYRPDSNTWTLGPSNIQRRTYHSTAVLLPDGRVLSAGDDRESKRNHPSQWVAEYYKPAYLFKGARPSIGGAPPAAGYHAAITVSTADAESIGSVVLTQPAATTHGVDMQQRTINMAPTVADSGHISVTTPTNPNVAPPGYYMMFLVNNQGVPSTARWIRIDPNAPTNAPPSAVVAADATTTTVGTRVNFSSASTDADGTIATQDWDLNGDGVFNDASGATASTIFTKAGTVTVSLRVTDDLGAASVGTVKITVTATSEPSKASPVPQNQAPIASFTVSTTKPFTGRPGVKLADTSRDPDGVIVSRAWDLDGDFRFDDGGLPTLNRAFKTFGRHIVRLRVTDNGGATSETEILLLARRRRPVKVVACTFTIRRHGKVNNRPGIVRNGTCVIKPGR
jgi:PKD repeat protein